MISGHRIDTIVIGGERLRPRCSSQWTRTWGTHVWTSIPHVTDDCRSVYTQNQE